MLLVLWNVNDKQIEVEENTACLEEELKLEREVRSCIFYRQTIKVP